MHHALREAARSEWGLVAFTTLLPTSVGVLAVATLAGQPLWPLVAAVFVAGVGLLASMGHLARPLRSPFSVRNWRQSWLSREILSAVAYWCLALASMLAGWLLPVAVLPLSLAALVMGGVLIWVIARSYRVQPRPAWDGPEGAAELVAVLLVAGVPAGMVSLGSAAPRWIGGLGVVAILAGLVLQHWATDHRLWRLMRMPAETLNAAETVLRCQELRASSRVVIVLDGVALLAALVAALGPQAAQVWFWGLSLLAALAGHLLARVLFYATPVQKRFVAKIRRPLSRRATAQDSL